MELTLHRQETLDFSLLSFRYPNDVQITSPFTGVIILEERRLGVEGSKQTKTRRPKEGADAATVPGRVGPPILALGAPTPLIFLPEASSWPKNDYIKGPQGFHKLERRWKHETPKRRSGAADWRGKTPVGRCRWCLHLLQRLLHRLHDEGGVVHPLDLGFVVVTWSNLSMYGHCWIPYDVPCISMDLPM